MRLKNILSILLLWNAYLNVNAQQAATVKSFGMTIDHISGNDRRNDLNGVPCALVKIQVVDDIERVEGNMIGEIVASGGVEKRVYLCKGTRQMKIHLKNYLPITVVFKDYKIQALESNRVYELVINTPVATPVDVSNAMSNELQMRLVPKNAIVVIWKEGMPKRMERANEDGILKIRLPYSRYNYSAEATGYERKEGYVDVFVDDESKIEEIRLKPITGEMVVDCSSKADIYINGVKQEKGKKDKSWLAKLPAGRYIVEARGKGLWPKLRRVDVASGQSTRIDFGDLLTEKDMKKKGIAVHDEVLELRDSVFKVREQARKKAAEAKKAYQEKVEAAKRANSYDIIQMLDGSIILCHVTDTFGASVKFKQKGNADTLSIPAQQVHHIDYSNGEYKDFRR